MPVDKLSSVNQKVVSSATLKKETASNTVNNETKKIDKKKLAVGIGAAAGVAALVVGGILYARRGKANPKLQEGIKNFIDSNGNKIEGIKLEKGKAIASDSSMFSGIMETITKSGKKVSIEYQDGFMTQSKINGKLFKKFENLTIPAQDGKTIQTLSRNQGTRIIKYDNDGNFNGMFEHLYHDNGKIKRAVSETKATDFFENGKIQAQEIRNMWKEPNKDGFIPQTLDDYTRTDSAKLFNQEGKLTDEIITGIGSDNRKIIKHLPDGSRVELSKVGYVNQEIPCSTTLVSERKFDAGKAKFFDADDKLKAEIECKPPRNGQGSAFYIFEYDKDSFNSADIHLGLDGRLGKIAVSGDDQAFALYDNGHFAGEKGNNFTAYIEKLKQIISDAKELHIDNADKISEQLSEFLMKFE